MNAASVRLITVPNCLHIPCAAAVTVYLPSGRFCPEKYHPFDPSVLDKYVVGDNYLPVWKVPSLGRYHNELRLGHRESLNAHLRAQGETPDGLLVSTERFAPVSTSLSCIL